MDSDMPDISPIGGALKRMREACEKGAKKDYIDTGKEIEKYGYSKDYEFLYQSIPEADLFFKARVNRTSEFVDIVGPYLYPENPKCTVTPAPHADTWAKRRAMVEEQLVDYFVKEGELDKHMRRGLVHALIYGRLPLWIGWNQQKGIPQAIYDESCNLGDDPDAKSPEERGFLYRRRVKPRYQLKQMFPDKAEVIALLPAYSEKASDSTSKYEAPDPAMEPIQYFEWWTVRGMHHYSGKVEPAQDETGQPVDGPAKYIECDGHLLYEGEWEAPYFKDAMWPVIMVDLAPKPQCLWPRAPMEPGLGHLRALNWLYTLYLSRIKLTLRTAFAVMTYNGQTIDDDSIIKVLKGNDLEVIRVTVNGDQLKLSDIFQKLDLTAGVDEFEKAANIIGREFEKSTGLSDLLYSGQSSTQIRSTGIAEIMDKAARNRMDEMRRCVERGMSDAMRHMLFLARFLMTPADVARILGEEAGTVWGQIATAEEVAREKQMRQQAMAAMAQPQMPGIDPMTGMPLPPPPPPTPEQMEEQLGPPSLVDFDLWMREADREVQGGSMRRTDVAAQVDNLNIALNQLAPAVAALPGGPAFIASIAKEFARINRFSPQLADAAEAFYQAAIAPPPMPMPPPPTGTPAGGPNAGPAGGEPMTPGMP